MVDHASEGRGVPCELIFVFVVILQRSVKRMVGVEELRPT